MRELCRLPDCDRQGAEASGRYIPRSIVEFRDLRYREVHPFDHPAIPNGAEGSDEHSVGKAVRKAGQNWAAYSPDLAICLGAHGQVQEANGRLQEALASFKEGILTLTPHLHQLPSAYAMIMGTLSLEYLRLAESAGSPPDDALLAPVVEVFQTLPPYPFKTRHNAPGSFRVGFTRLDHLRCLPALPPPP